MYFECCRCHKLVDDGCPSLLLCLDCLDEIAEKEDMGCEYEQES